MHTLTSRRRVNLGVSGGQAKYDNSLARTEAKRRSGITWNHNVTTTILDSLRISDIVAISRTCWCMRVLAHEVVQGRLMRLLGPFTRDHLSSFLSALKDAGGVITGSTVQAMVKYDEDYIRRDLNIIVPYKAFDSLHGALEDMLGFTLISSVPHPALAPRISRFCRYAWHERIITVSASHEGKSVLHIIINAPMTTDMLFMTTGGVCYFYPQWFEAGLAIQSCTGNLVPETAKLGCAGELIDEFEVETGTACGNLCPTYWHHVKEKHLQSSINWNAEDSVTNMFHNVNIEWQLNMVYTNQKCSHHVEVMSQNFKGVGACNLMRRHLRRTFSRVPGSNVTMDEKYTLYFERCQPSMQPSYLLRRMGSMSGSCKTLHGSVVVVKQTRDTPNAIMDMTKQDQLMANFLISRHQIHERQQGSFDELSRRSIVSLTLDGMDTLFDRPVNTTQTNTSMSGYATITWS
ncbi:uncharacterized protein F5891DRAFT_985214 [Suillus fuscotomentosus]|uniref:Uncharacterized protein n=1 Tax=Suillus fuscotomentosus TaxID=1912939 RepID=A0AAD4DUJ7_9AGAM|nr:uncharacterized protein F5891DRAFT_985214 [Suillus fuscotomentosus]KAG1894215.1 hypothetical protein F5891DRAFT_985214 [Suillus fuscotomentosus]